LIKRRRYIIFRCENDGCWTVAVGQLDDPIWKGVADCPDEKTARAVLSAMQMREQQIQDVEREKFRTRGDHIK